MHRLKKDYLKFVVDSEEIIKHLPIFHPTPFLPMNISYLNQNGLFENASIEKGLFEICGGFRRDQTLIFNKLTFEYRTLIINYFLKFKTLEELKLFIFKSLEFLVSTNNIKCIILNNFESFLYTEKYPRKKNNEIFYIVKKLKNLIFKNNLIILVSNNFYESWSVEDVSISNKYLGMNWNYLRNGSFRIMKNSITRETYLKKID